MAQQLTKNLLSFNSGHSFHSKDTIRVPESHTLHVGPPACARRHAIKAVENHDIQNMSFLALSEEDVAVGYDRQIIQAVRQLNEVLDPRPRLYLICVKCIDDLLGTDDEALVEELCSTFPNQRFAVTHINPISLSATRSPAEKGKATLFQFIDTGQSRDQGITLMGSFATIPDDCEFRQVVKDWGMGPIRRILDCKTYQDYQDMGKSALLLLNSPMGKHAANELHQRLGTPLIASPVGYDPRRWNLFYRQLANLCGKPIPDALDVWEQEAHQALERAATALRAKSLSVIVDSSAVMQPFALSKTLLEYGFSLCCISSKDVEPIEQKAYQWLTENHPEVPVVRTHSYQAFATKGYRLPADPLVIGADFARIQGFSRVVDIWHDEGFFGFQGIVKLASMIEEAAR